MLARTATGTVSSHSQPLVCTTILPELAPGFKTLVSSLQCTTRVQINDQNHGILVGPIALDLPVVQLAQMNWRLMTSKMSRGS